MPIRRLKLEMAAAQILIDWHGQYIPLTAEHVYGGWRCRVTLEAVGVPIVGTIPADAPTESERDIIECIRAAGRRLTQPEVLDALAKAGRLHGDSTIIKALARMVRDGRLTNVSRRGYGLTEVVRS